MGLNVSDYNLVNPTAASGRGQYFDTAGNTITATTQPRVDSGAMAGTFGQDPGSDVLEGVNTYRVSPTVYDSVMATGAELQKALTASSRLGGVTAGQYIMPLVTDLIAGLAHSAVRSPGSYYDAQIRSIHQRENVWTRGIARAIRAGYWNAYTGSFTTAPVAQDDMSAFETNGTDDAANPSRSVPGELVYADGKPNPVQDDYEAKNG